MFDIRLERAYDPPSDDDGARILVERLWPRGVSREDAALDAWLKEVAPSPELREWYGHDCRLTLVLATKDVEHSSAALLKQHLEERLAGRGGLPRF
ncbi:MAG: DUF488 domain-containing protein [Gemmatimonadota bacterium]